ncbi:MAG: hypothetical protein LBI68_04255, partial [Azoarcus sp.]|nr:hypothetical protein [Azoarcus sp.]
MRLPLFSLVLIKDKKRKEDTFSVNLRFSEGLPAPEHIPDRSAIIMPAMQELNAYFARKALDKLELANAYQPKINEITRLMEDAEPARVRVSKVLEQLYPEASSQYANDMIQNLVQHINGKAKDKELKFEMKISSDKETDRRVWFEGMGPKPDAAPTAQLCDVRGNEPVIVLITFNVHESAAVRKMFCQEGRPVTRLIEHPPCDSLTILNGRLIVHCTSEQGVNRANKTCQNLIEAFTALKRRLIAIIAVGIAFGLDEKRQRIGDVLVAKSVYDYELGRESEGGFKHRGESYRCSQRLLEKLHHLQHIRDDFLWPGLHFGTLLSGNKLIDNLKVRDELAQHSPGVVVGGEMEGVGMYYAIENKDISWLIVKGICDWGNGAKDNPHKERDQKRAANNAALVVHEALRTWQAEHEDGGPFNPEPERIPDADLQDLKEAAGRLMDTKGMYVGTDQEVRDAWNTDIKGTDAMSALRDWMRQAHPPHLFALLGDSLKKAAGRLMNPKEMYVGTDQEARDARNTDIKGIDVMSALRDWMRQAHPPHLFALLGESGMGKTIACQRLVKECHVLRVQDASAPLVLYFDLRNITGLRGKCPTLAETLEECMERGWL